MTVDEKIWKLARLLHDKTAAGMIKWEQTPEKNSFQTSFPKHTVQISDDSGNWGVRYTIAIFNEEGSIVEQASDQTISTTVREATPYPRLLMEELYTMARRSAVGADAALDELIAELS